MSLRQAAVKGIEGRSLGSNSAGASKRSKARNRVMSKVATVIVAGGGFISVVSLPANSSLAVARPERVRWHQIDVIAESAQMAQVHLPARKVPVVQFDNDDRIQKIFIVGRSKMSG